MKHRIIIEKNWLWVTYDIKNLFVTQKARKSIALKNVDLNQVKMTPRGTNTMGALRKR